MNVEEKWKEQYFSSTYSIYSVYRKNIILYAFGEHNPELPQNWRTFASLNMLKHDWKRLNENSTPDQQAYFGKKKCGGRVKLTVLTFTFLNATKRFANKIDLWNGWISTFKGYRLAKHHSKWYFTLFGCKLWNVNDCTFLCYFFCMNFPVSVLFYVFQTPHAIHPSKE